MGKSHTYFTISIIIVIVLCSAQMASILSSYWLTKKVSVSAESSGLAGASASANVGVGVWTG